MSEFSKKKPQTVLKSTVLVFSSFAAGALLAFLLLEGAIAFFLAHPSPLSKRLLGGYLRSIYFNDYRGVIQFDPASARYDPRLTYTLRPGKFTFGSSEFSDVFTVNSRGLRDSEAALNKPEVIVLGDSMAMGWGAPQNRTLAKVIEKRTGLKTLNAAVSSYGTPREMLLLGTLDTSGLKYLVLQYHFSDFEENYFYRDNNNAVSAGTREDYDRQVRDHLKRKEYYPGKYGLLTYRLFRRGAGGDRQNTKFFPEGLYEDEAALLLNALQGPVKALKPGVKLIILEVPPRKDFHAALVSELKKAGLADSIRAIDLYGRFGAADYYLLDDHIRPVTHEKLADIVISEGMLRD